MKRILFVLALCLCVAVGFAGRPGYTITENGFSQSAQFKLYQNCVSADSNRAITTGGLAATSATTATFNVGTTFPYLIDGVFYSKTASATVAGVSATVQATGTTCTYLFCVDTAGAVSVTKGDPVTYGKTARTPDVPASKCPFGTLNVAITTTATSAFTLGTTATAGITGQTLTVANISTVQNTTLTDF